MILKTSEPLKSQELICLVPCFLKRMNGIHWIEFLIHGQRKEFKSKTIIVISKVLHNPIHNASFIIMSDNLYIYSNT